jgi:hypothetical protein
MDDRQIEEVRSWALGLVDDASTRELKAAAKAILLLSDDLRSARARLDANLPASGRPRAAPDPHPELERDAGLRARLSARDAGSPTEPTAQRAD